MVVSNDAISMRENIYIFQSHNQHVQQPADSQDAVTERMEPNSSLLGKMVKQHEMALKCGIVSSS